MDKVAALQDVQIDSVWFAKGTVFAVAEIADVKATPPVVDRTRADAWVREKWAESPKAKKA